MWDVVFGEQAQTVLSRLSNGKDSPIREFDIPQALQLIQVARPEKQPCLLPACLTAMVSYIFVSPDTKSSPVLVNY